MKLFHLVSYRIIELMEMNITKYLCGTLLPIDIPTCHIRFLRTHLCLGIQYLNCSNGNAITLLTKRFLDGFDQLLAVIMYTY